MIIHSVYFTLKDKSPAVLEAFLNDTKTFGKNIPGVEYFQVGQPLANANRPVHDKEFDVALVAAYADETTLNTYLQHPDHLAFCERNGGNWVKIRVFDFEN